MKKILVLVFTAAGYFANAQAGFTNTGNLQIHGGAFITGFSNFTNSSAGNLINNGSLHLKADITNDQSSMPAGTGTLYLDGTAMQTINGSQVFKTYNLITDNAAGFLLNNNLSAAGVHSYTTGMITTSATPNYMIYEAGSSYTGSSDARHVNGWVKKIGNTNFSFPVGNATYERPVSLSTLSASGEFNVRYNVAVTPNYNNLNTPLVLIDTSEYWTINRVSGGTAQVTMNWDVSKVPFPNVMLSSIRASYYNGSLWSNIGGSATGVVAISGSVTSNSTNIFNTNFVIASTSFVLPLKIISFTANRSNGYTRINYTIGNELNVSRYELEKSDDGINFHTINTHAAFNRNGTEFYSYTDNSALKGTAFYRLKIIELSSQVSYSPVVSVADHSKELYVIKNPVDESIEIYASAYATGTYSYVISATNGQAMQTGSLEIKQPGICSIKLQSLFASGSYMLVLKSKEISMQKMIIKN